MDDVPEYAYAMAAEKMVNLLQTIDNTLEFMDEYKIKPDENVQKALKPVIERLKDWCK